MKQDLYFEFVPIVIRKGSPYLARLNKLIHKLLDSGLMLKWEDQVRYTSAGLLHKWRVSKMTARNISWISAFSRFLGGEGRPGRGADNLTAICELIVLKMWEPRRLTTLWAFMACYRDSFTF
jgi:hypothetical protein